MTKIDYMWEHQEAIEDAIREFYRKTYGDKYQSDLYMYITDDAPEFHTFCNVGGNSWLDDNHYVVCIHREDIENDETGEPDDWFDPYDVFCNFVEELENEEF